MIDVTAEILHSDGFVQKRIREQYQEHFRFIQVDEAQDLTQIQFDILQIIAASRNIFVVADDDQSIYGFRGASPSCVSSFYRNQNDCKLYHLSKNYRSVQNIVRTSEQFISKNTERFDKNLYSEKECGRMPQIKECRNSLLQAEFVVKELRKLQRRNPYLETGILYRNNISGLLISAVFAKENMSYYHQGDLPESSEIVFLESVLQKIRDRERSERHILPQPIQTFRNLLEEGLEREFELYCRDTRQHMRYKDAVLFSFIYVAYVLPGRKRYGCLIKSMPLEKQMHSATFVFLPCILQKVWSMMPCLLLMPLWENFLEVALLPENYWKKNEGFSMWR